MAKCIKAGTEFRDPAGKLYLTFVKPFQIGQTLRRDMVKFASENIPASGSRVPAWLLTAIGEKIRNG